MFIARVLVGPSKQLKQIFQIERNIVKNLKWPEPKQLATYKRGRGFERETRTRDRWIASPTRWPLGHVASPRSLPMASWPYVRNITELKAGIKTHKV